MTRTWYLAGPMTGFAQFNFPLFTEAAAALRARGFNLVSPHEMDSEAVQSAALVSTDGTLDADGKIAGETWGDILSKDVKLIADKIQGIIFLPQWQKSRGARLEAMTALLCGHSFKAIADTQSMALIELDANDVITEIYRATFR